MKIAICTGGGDCPGLNAAIKAFVEICQFKYHSEVVGIYDSFNGLSEQPHRYATLGLPLLQDIQSKGGTILGTCNTGQTLTGPKGKQTLDSIVSGFKSLALDAMVVIGGEGTQTMTKVLAAHLPVVGIPKTIDNDLPGTEQTIGFTSCVDLVAESVMRLQSTAESHHRILILEVMGRDSGFIALHGGIAGGANVILLPEIAYSLDSIVKTIEERKKRGLNFSVIVASEGAAAKNQDVLYQDNAGGKKTLGGVGQVLAQSLFEATGSETRCTVLGHLQRGGAPNAADKILAFRFASHAAKLVHDKKFSRLVVLKQGHITDVGYDSIDPSQRRKIELNDDLLVAAGIAGISLGV